MIYDSWLFFETETDSKKIYSKIIEENFSLVEKIFTNVEKDLKIQKLYKIQRVYSEFDTAPRKKIILY